MQLNFTQQQTMGQVMKLAPRMIQSMEILQLPIMALQERIDQELEENVVLELKQKKEEGAPDPETKEERLAKEREKDVDQKEVTVDSDHNNETDFERLLEISKEWPDDNVMEGSRPSANRIADEADRVHDQTANLVARPSTLQDHLLEQLHYFEATDDIMQFAEYLIQNLDPNGRLQGTLPEIVQVYGRSISIDDADEALSFIQEMEPKGVGARDLKECLLLQIDRKSPNRDVLITLISNHLDDLAQNRIPLIQKKTGYSVEMIKEAVEEMKSYDPFPGKLFESVVNQNVTADVWIDQDKTGKYVVRLDRESTPPLRISSKYIKMLENNPDPQTKEYIKRKIESAKWLINSIEQRNSTVKKVAQSIVDHQTAFLDKGEEFIVPLKMQQIADLVGVHVTTVSRAVDDKWIQTPRGLFPLKRFFGGGTTTADGEEVAWDIIRLKLKEIVDSEDKSKPYSDDALVEQLSRHGYNLARRTVTKYRKALDIPSSRQRREY